MNAAEQKEVNPLFILFMSIFHQFYAVIYKKNRALHFWLSLW